MIKPLGNLVLIKPIEEVKETKTAGGLIVPGSLTEKNYDQGKVIAVADGHEHMLNKTVIFGKGFGKTIDIDGQKSILIPAHELWGIL